MNPFTYKEFQNDMLEATKDFVLNTDYSVEDISDSSIILSNGKKFLNFYLEAFTLVAEISNKDGSDCLAFYELFERENIMNEYPKVEVPPFSSIEESYSFNRKFNKFKIKELLRLLTHRLYHYI